MRTGSGYVKHNNRASGNLFAPEGLAPVAPSVTEDTMAAQKTRDDNLPREGSFRRICAYRRYECILLPDHYLQCACGRSHLKAHPPRAKPATTVFLRWLSTLPSDMQMFHLWNITTMLGSVRVKRPHAFLRQQRQTLKILKWSHSLCFS